MIGRARALGIALALGLVASACASTGAYPREVFTEMHYTQSYRSQEPPRLKPAPLSVPITGRAVEPATFLEAQETANPVPLTAGTMERARALYAVNCAMCHGAQGRGNSYIATLFGQAGTTPPVDFASDRVKARNPGQVYWFLTVGLGNMPPFGKLLTSEERWLLVHYVRSVAGQ
ncbi:MAG: cytochrome c [Chloroflexi bacterium]|nr:cytochrome c [Chloroflexota bacterium]